MATLEKRLTDLEGQVKTLSKLIKSGIAEKEDLWLKVTDAAHALGLSPDTLRRKIREAQENSESPYKKGIHWDRERTYKVNVSRWNTVI